jgi:hypothetical protein
VRNGGSARDVGAGDAEDGVVVIAVVELDDGVGCGAFSPQPTTSIATAATPTVPQRAAEERCGRTRIVDRAPLLFTRVPLRTNTSPYPSARVNPRQRFRCDAAIDERPSYQ